MTKLKLIEKPYGKKRFAIFYKREKLAEFSTKESANKFAEIYLVPPYTMQANVWHN